ncbi:MAG TPA: 4-alpha-glucanotransferase, partial [Terriglobia bacterium]|nr:4-alpha-glucanotransferase [Terriglobia bacterium]
MNVNRDSSILPPFAPEYRASGLLLHVTSLPSPYGIGDVGPAALSWIDRLHEAGQSWWQVLPLNPTGYGNSPYLPLSSFAGDPLLISLDGLIQDELLRAGDAKAPPFPQHRVDYKAVSKFKYALLDKAWANFSSGTRADLRPAFENFLQGQAHWLEDYALFRALRAKFQGTHYREWPAELIRREPAALNRARIEMANHIGRASFRQFLLFRQGERLKAHAHSKGVGLIGDLPFFISPESSDVWAHPEFFLLDERHHPRFVAGVPPDYFAEDGQLWGNPVYDWDALRQSGYGWWISRLRALLAHVDVIRLDHFRGFAAAWHVPAGAATAKVGEWVPGPGADFLQVVKSELGALPFIAEDLGMITPDVYALRDKFHLPGMRVLQFAFDGGADNPYLPENYVTNTAAYTGTHDNPTTRGWFEELPPDRRQKVSKYLKLKTADAGEVVWDLMGLAWRSVAALAMAPLQDLLNLGNEARMNVPGQAVGNWEWRATEKMLSGKS